MKETTGRRLLSGPVLGIGTIGSYRLENFFLVDMESGNGTSLNGTILQANEKNLLSAATPLS